MVLTTCIKLSSVNNISIAIIQKTRALLLSFVFCILSFLNYSQVNYVQNASFEKVDSCDNINFYYPPEFWDTLRAGGGGGPEICSPCMVDPGLRTPTNGYRKSYQVPRTGTNYCFYTNYGSNTVSPSYPYEREYIQNQLNKSLTNGKNYCVKFYVSLMNESKYAITEFGAYLDDGSIHTIYYGVSTVVPQIKSPVGLFLTDTLNWTEVKGTYVANGTEKYLTLGNFKTTATTNFSVMIPPTLPPNIQRNVADYYIDDVSIIEMDLPAFAGRDTVLCSGDSIFIGRPLEIGLECTWFNNATQIATGGGFYVKPTTSQSYIVQQDVCGIITKDTVQVIVKPNFSGAPKIQSSYLELCPNDTTNLTLINLPSIGNIYLWQSNLTLTNYSNNITKAKISGSVTMAGNYNIYATVQNNGSGLYCPFIAKDSVTIKISDTCFKEVIIPNIFTPNGDQVNDVWRIKMPLGVLIQEVEVFNRWGILIYQLDNTNLQNEKLSVINWDGHTNSGEVCSSGVYFYVIKYRDRFKEKKVLKGNVSLIR
ncbi:MAG: gliding motility-associated C-terminal domain-containing protein [Bacteroidia bacterium]